VANFYSMSVSKLLASTGATVGTFTVGVWPDGVAFDGTNIWVVNEFSNSVTKIPAF
jgi:DNA-binding beta-propeller fold protein YncE